MVAHHEERGRDLVFGECFEDPVGGRGIGTIVKREVHSSFGPRATPDDRSEDRAVGIVRRGERAGTSRGRRQQLDHATFTPSRRARRCEMTTGFPTTRWYTARIRSATAD